MYSSNNFKIIKLFKNLHGGSTLKDDYEIKKDTQFIVSNIDKIEISEINKYLNEKRLSSSEFKYFIIKVVKLIFKIIIF